MRTRAWLSLVCIAVAGLGCGSTPVVPTFTLDATVSQPVSAPAVLPVAVGISRFQAPVPYARRSVMWREGSQLGYYTTATWSDTPQDLLTDALVQLARNEGGFAEVRRLSSGYGASPDLVVHARIEAFEAALHSPMRDAHIALFVAVTDGSNQEVLWEGLIDQVVPVKTGQMDDLLSAFAVAQRAALQEIIDRTRGIAEGGAFDRFVERSAPAQ